jgi:acetyl esterase/lipase
MVKTIYVVLFMLFPVSAQIFIDSKGIPRDNYFTRETVQKKVLKTFPLAKLVTLELSESLQVDSNITYKKIGSRNLHLDIFHKRQVSGNNLPLIMFVHGGGWRSGNKIMEWPFANYFAQHGFITVTIEYRLSPEAKYPAAIYDLKDAILWIKSNAVLYNIDTNMIAICGESSGGLLSTLTGVTGKNILFGDDQFFNGKDFSVQAVINIDGYCDFTKSDACFADTNSNFPTSESRWLGGSYEQIPDVWKEASPVYYLSKSTPPILFLNSSLSRYSAGQSEMITELKKMNIYYEQYTVNNTPHPFWLFYPWFEPTTEHIINFLSRVFKLE